MTAPLALGGWKNRQTRPAEIADNTGLDPRQQAVAGHAHPREQQVDDTRYALPNADLPSDPG
ncbi:MAG: hypothetical protein ABI469_00120 [Gemmatimonadales bacterium]